MQGIEKPVLNPYGLTPPSQILYPAYAPLRYGMRNGWSPPRYVPGPLPDGAVRVHLSDDYYLGPVWGDYRPQDTCSPESVFDIPAEQRDRWQAAMDAYTTMQAEIEMLMDARRRDPESAKRGPYIPQP